MGVNVLVRGRTLFLLVRERSDWCERTPLESGACHGDMDRGRLARTYVSREGGMSW